MVAQHGALGPQVHGGAVQRAAIALDDAHAHIQPVLASGLGELGDFRAIERDGGVVVFFEVLAPLGRARTDEDVKVRPLGVAADERLRKHQHLGAAPGRLLHQCLGLGHGGGGVEHHGGGLGHGCNHLHTVSCFCAMGERSVPTNRAQCSTRCASQPLRRCGARPLRSHANRRVSQATHRSIIHRFA